MFLSLFDFLSTEFAACSKPASRDGHKKVSYPKTQPGCKLNLHHAIRVVVEAKPFILLITKMTSQL